jgi:PucR family transcriptional regulator, purine catabolism regulatory protein
MARSLRELSDTAVAPTLGGRLRVGDALAFPALRGARVVAGESGLSRALLRVNVMQVPTVEFARRDELILAASSAFDDHADPAALIAALADRGVAALAAQFATLDKLGPAGLAVGRARSLPLVELPADTRLNELLTDLLETLVASQATHLRLAGAVRDELVDVVISGAGLQRLADAIAGLAGGSIAIVDADGQTLAASDDADTAAAACVASDWLRGDWSAPADAGDGWIVWPIIAAGARLGCVVARLSEPREPVMLAAVQSGARSAAFEIVHQLEEAAAVTRLTEQFVRDLLVGALDPVAARTRASAVGWDSRRPYRILLAHAAGAVAAVVDAARRESPAGLVMVYNGDCLLLGSAGADSGDLFARAADALVARSVDVRVGISAWHTEIAQMPVAYAEAREALTCAQRFHRRSRWREFDPCSPLRMLSQVPVDQLQRFARDTLAPLDRLGADQARALVATLRLLVDTGLNVAETARRGGWHYNTVRYRVARLSELLGPFMEDGARLDSLTLALLLRRELGGDDDRRDGPSAVVGGDLGQAVEPALADCLGDDAPAA